MGKETQSEREDNFTCDWQDCGKVCKSKAGLTVHRRRMHERSDLKVVFKCPDCSLPLLYESNLKNNQKSCTGRLAEDPDRRRCNICDKEVSKSNFSRHRKGCGGDQQPAAAVRPAAARARCDICGLMFSRANMSRHKRNIH